MSFGHRRSLSTKGDRKNLKKVLPTLEDKLLTEKQTQTSKTILQLARDELEKKSISPPGFSRKSDILNAQKSKLNVTCPAKVDQKTHKSNVQEISQKNFNQDPNQGYSLTQLSLSQNSQASKQTAYSMCQGSVDKNSAEEVFSVPQWSRFTIKEIRVKSVDAANNVLIQDYKKDDSSDVVQDDLKTNVMNNVINKLNSSRRGRSLSPAVAGRRHRSPVDSDSQGSLDSTKTKDVFHGLINSIKSQDWNVSLKALILIAEKALLFEHHRIFSHMTEINQKLIEFLRSPRSQVCRAACQVAGKLFESIKDTRRPEFDDIVELLLLKTADSNKFIRKDANLALDSLIMNISYIHTIRAITQKGPSHKNDLIRISSARLYVCIVGIAGVNVVLNLGGNECSRQRIFENMVNFIKDRNPKTREYGVRLYRLLHDHQNFDFFFKKFIDKSLIIEVKKIIKKM